MDESRFNYVAQPEDGIDPARPDPEDRRVRQVRDALGLRAGGRREDAGRARTDAGPVGARAGQGRVAAVLDRGPGQHRSGRQPRGRRHVAIPVKATDAGRQEPGARLRHDAQGDEHEDRRSVGRPRNRLRPHGPRSGPPRWATSSASIGGLESQQVHIGQGDGMRFKTVPTARQQEALQFLLANAFTTPAFMIKPEILRRIQAGGRRRSRARRRRRRCWPACCRTRGSIG